MIKLATRIFEKMFLADKWNVGFIDQSINNLIEQRKIKNIVWLKEDVVDYAADPFIVEINNQIKIFYEELDFWHGRGKIMMIEGFNFQTKKEVKGIVPSSIHLSYPYLISRGEELYCIPETSQAQEVALYHVNPLKLNLLKKHNVLISGKEYVDSSIIFFENRYWLFTSVSGDNDHMYIFYSSSIDGNYLPHQLNPIPVQKQACRGAGSLFILNNFIYRPTQNPTNCYGGSIQINKILELTEKVYETECAFEIFPDKTYNRGVHHISFCKDKIVLDGKRRVFQFLMPLKKLVKVIRK